MQTTKHEGETPPPAPSTSPATEQDQSAYTKQRFDDPTLIQHPGYSIKWDSQRRVPAWSSYRITRKQLNNKHVKRTNEFMKDPLVADSPNPWDYKRTGYDRGHMAPAGSLAYSYDTMRASFYMTNMAPQKPELNREIWNSLEQKVRNWARYQEELWVVTGTYGLMAYLPSGVGVPQAFFKAVYRLPDESHEGYAIGFYLPAEGPYQKLQVYAMSIDQLEALVSIDLFSELPDEIEDRIEAVQAPWAI